MQPEITACILHTCTGICQHGGKKFFVCTHLLRFPGILRAASSITVAWDGTHKWGVHWLVVLFHTVISGVKRTFMGAMLDLEEYIELPTVAAAAAAAAGAAPTATVAATSSSPTAAEPVAESAAAAATSTVPTATARLTAAVRAAAAAARSKGAAPTAAARSKAAARLAAVAATAEAVAAAAAAEAAVTAAAKEKLERAASAGTHSRALHATIRKFDLEGMEITFAVVDSAATNVGGKGGAVKLMGDLLMGTSGIHGAPYVLHCYAHILHNALETAIKNWGLDTTRLRVGSSGVLQHMLDRVAAKSRLKQTELGIKHCNVCPASCVTRWNGYTAIAVWLVNHYDLLTEGLRKLLAASSKPDAALLQIAEDLVNPDLMLQVTTLASWGV